MLMVNQLIGFGASSESAVLGTIAFTKTATPSRLSSDPSNYTGVSIGPATSDRIIVVSAGAHNGAATAPPGFVSLTIDGSPMTQIVTQGQTDAGAGNGARASIYALLWPTGTTATFALDMDGAYFNQLVIYSMTGANPTVYDTAGVVAGADAVIDAATGGLVFASAFANSTGAGAHTWTGTAGLTKDADVTGTGGGASTAWKIFTPAGGINLTVAANAAGTIFCETMCAASWQPA